MQTVADIRTAPAVSISLDASCDFPSCAELAMKLHGKMATGAYTWPCSVMQLPASIDEWNAEHRTARKRAAACLRHGYAFREIDRTLFVDDVFAINTSAESRQGRPMTHGYRLRPSFSPLPAYPCSRHAVRTFGVISPDGHLAAYTWMYRTGELVMFSTIIGHAEHLSRHVMYLLIRGALEAHIAVGPGVAFYGMHNSGQEGLRWMKERVGFQAARVDWVVA